MHKQGWEDAQELRVPAVPLRAGLTQPSPCHASSLPSSPSQMVTPKQRAHVFPRIIPRSGSSKVSSLAASRKLTKLCRNKYASMFNFSLSPHPISACPEIIFACIWFIPLSALSEGRLTNGSSEGICDSCETSMEKRI